MSTTITVVGNFSGRNAGDAAILDGVLLDISKRYGDVKFLVPTIRPEFVRRQYADFNVEPVGLMPWNGSAKILGIPIISCVVKSDVILLTDAILFDHKLFNPLFNYLSTMALALPFAKALGRAVILYNVNLGPIYTRPGRWCLNRVLRSANEIIVRDKISLLEVSDPLSDERVSIGADSALNARIADGDRTNQILLENRIDPGTQKFITLTANSYLNAFRPKSEKPFSEDYYLNSIAEAVNRFLETRDVRLLLVITQVMDTRITRKLCERIRDPSRVSVLSTSNYSFADIAGVFSRSEMHIGARTHSLILAAAQFTPLVALLITPKNRGFMESINQERYAVEASDLNVSLFDAMQDAWNNRPAIRQALMFAIQRERKKIEVAAERLAPYLLSKRDDNLRARWRGRDVKLL